MQSELGSLVVVKRVEGTGNPVIEPLADIKIGPAIAALPKADIHLHSEAAPRLEQVMAERSGKPVTDWRAHARELMHSLPPGMPRLETWGPDLPFPRAKADELDRPANFKARIGRVLAEAATDGAVLVEVLFGGSTILRDDFPDLFGEALAEVRSRFPRFHAVPLVAARTTEEWAETLLPRCIAGAGRGLAGLNILPAPYDRPADWSAVHRWAARARDAGLGITAHAGELGALHLAEALEVPGLMRIGHAIGAAADARMLDRVAERGLTIECALSSNVVIGAVESYESHPIRRFVQRGIPVAICTDDPVRACTSIGREYAIASRLGFSTAALREFTANAVRASFCTRDVHDRLLRLWSDSATMRP